VSRSANVSLCVAEWDSRMSRSVLQNADGDHSVLNKNHKENLCNGYSALLLVRDAEEK
jgi:hypothetical protein